MAITAVPAKLAAAVDRRDDRCCFRCGRSLTVVAGSRHHRMRRAVGGHHASNLILLCGSGTTGCHGWAHAHPEQARAEGFIVPANRDLEPQHIPIHHWALGWVYLDDDPQPMMHAVPRLEALEAIAMFGLSRSY